ncbi:hypothetical protein GCM10025867_46280 (plasmid) [Frondihabitans sucicola]|uniref:Uncharacterized protein n=1 Tax=Frondihabitans sucicola TaxID=1268041 RepID=A0ABM8GV91_9MICO|nr:hypothetical protein [Frondihabitans sucicola]BDZ52387.1 hypothetical protein GCM10025867_46280 [Frondihabitans sucicola]
MKIKIELTINVDPEDWSRSYGTGTDAKAVRNDVKSWVRGWVSEHPENLIEVVA